MKFFAAPPDVDHEVRLLQKAEVFGHGLPGHVEMAAQLTQGLGVVRVQLIEEFSPVRAGESLKDSIHVRHYATKWLPVQAGARFPLLILIRPVAS